MHIFEALPTQRTSPQSHRWRRANIQTPWSVFEVSIDTVQPGPAAAQPKKSAFWRRRAALNGGDDLFFFF